MQQMFIKLEILELSGLSSKLNLGDVPQEQNFKLTLNWFLFLFFGRLDLSSPMQLKI